MSRRQRRRGRSGGSRTSWDTFAPARPFQAVWVGLAVLLLLPGLVLTSLRLVPPTEDAPALVASFISYAVLSYLACLLFFLVALARARRRGALGVLSAVTAALLGCHVWWVSPLFLADDRPLTTDTFSVMTINVLHGRADPGAVAQQALAADLVVLPEATPSLLADLERHGWRERFPHVGGGPQAGGESTALYSRYPVTDVALLSMSQDTQWVATVAVPQLGPVRVIAAHPCNPYCGSGRWHGEHQQLSDAAAANGDRPLVVAGDLNAVEDHGPMIAMRRAGLKTATDIVGAGWLPTFPAHSSIPPLLPIDHVMVNRFLTVTSVQRFRVAGTDHLGLLAQIAGTRA